MSTVSQPSATVEQSLEHVPPAAATGFPSDLPQTWQRCLLAYLARMYNAGSRPRTIRTHRKIVLAFLSSLLDAGRSPGQANPQDFIGFAQRVQEADLLYASVAEMRVCLRNFYRFAGSFLPSGEIISDVIEPPASAEQKASRARQPQAVPRDEHERALPVPEITDNPWAECAAHFIRKTFNKSQSSASANTYWYTLKRFFQFIGDTSPDQVSTREIDNYINEPSRRSGKPPTAGYRNQRLAVIKKYYAFAAGFVPKGYNEPLFQKRNPCDGLEYGIPEKHYRAFNEQELEALFARIDRSTAKGKRDYAFFCTLLLTSRRREEILRLKFGDIYQSTITEQGQQRKVSMFRFHQKGRGQQWETQELPPVCYQAIIDYLTADERLKTIQPDDYLFTSEYTAVGRHVHGGTMNRRLQAYCEKAGLKKTAKCIHSFRHSSIQLRLANGEDIISTMQISGHKSLDAFLTYARALQGVRDPGAAKLEKHLSFLAGGE